MNLCDHLDSVSAMTIMYMCDVWDIKLHALASSFILTAAVCALSRFKALPRADVASHQKCPRAFFHQYLCNKNQMKAFK